MLRKLISLLKSVVGTTGQRLKYGWEHGSVSIVDGMTLQASLVVKAASGYFFTVDSSGNAGLTGAASTFINGSLMAPGQDSVTFSATAGADKLAANVGVDAIYRIPVGSGTYARTNRFKLCDCVVASNVQGAAVQVSTRGHLILLDGDETNNKWVTVRINPALTSAGSAS
jgi:hypothetical protein